jgi:hypothetical protein
MAEYVGRDAIVLVSTNGLLGGSGNWVEVGQVKSSGLQRNTDKVSVKHRGTGGWDKSLPVGRTWGMTCEVVLDRADAVWEYLLTKWRTSSLVPVRVDATAIGGVKEEGMAVIDSLPEEYPESDAVSGTAELGGSGALSVVA